MKNCSVASLPSNYLKTKALLVIDKLDFILALAREKHFGRAAEHCDVSQAGG